MWVKNLQVINCIDDSDKVSAIGAAHYRLQAKMRELESQFEQKAAELRAAFVQEVSTITAEAAE